MCITYLPILLFFDYCTDKYTISLDGPGGGTVIYTILADETNVTNQHYGPDNPSGDSPDLYYHYNNTDYYSYPAPTSDPGIFRDRIHLFRFYDYAGNGLKVEGNVAFVFGYEDYPSSYDAYIYSTALDAWSNHVGWWGDPAKGNDPTPGAVEITGFFHSTARHRFIIWWNGSAYQLTNWFFVDDYADAWQRTTVILPVTF